MMKMGKRKKESNRNLLDLKVKLSDIELPGILNGWHGFCLVKNGKVAFGGINNG